MERNLRKTRVGLVSSDKMDKTVVVSIQSGSPAVWQDRKPYREVQSTRREKRMRRRRQGYDYGDPSLQQRQEMACG